MKTLLILFAALLAIALPTHGADSAGPVSTEKSSTDGRPVARSYVLKPNDVVLVTVFGEPELQAREKIEADGYIRFPYLEKVFIATNTVDQAIQKFEKLLKDGYLVHPQVNITLIESAKKTVTILGFVSKPGPYPLDEEGIPILDAIGFAGGISNLGTLNKVTLVRAGQSKPQLFKLQKMQDDGQALPKVYPGDRINVGERTF
ncbi:MAG: polysaccharide export protein [Verrucomicrobiales bacterium]|jgi:protein involved in polysaccharide export with SLBB domain|nr:polysaccharide export protein [Verrucomicrobiales bacterium]MDB6130031.1 polysaccharide export protein [Verrucomicrobiales bacterium]